MSSHIRRSTALLSTDEGRGPARIRSTTVLAVRDDSRVALAGDGQVTFGNSVMKRGARKIRLLHGGDIIAGFAGSAADAFALFGRFEEKLSEFNGKLSRAAVALAQDWRTDRALRKLDAMLLTASADLTLLISGTGDLIEPDDGIAAIGSGAPPAMAAARGLARHSDLDAESIARESLAIAASIDIYTNEDIHVESLASQASEGSPD